jgi:hypothetical protein
MHATWTKHSNILHFEATKTCSENLKFSAFQYVTPRSLVKFLSAFYPE